MMVSDSGPQFGGMFHGQMCSCSGVERKMSTSFNPPTDCQTEGMKASMEQYVGVFINHQQDERVKYLPMAKFAANNTTSETTKCTLIFAIQGVDRRMRYLENHSIDQEQRCLDGNQVQAVMQQVHEHLPVEIKQSQALQEKGANRQRIPAPKIQVESHCLTPRSHGE